MALAVDTFGQPAALEVLVNAGRQVARQAGKEEKAGGKAGGKASG